jgi:hypothetical protein
MAGGGLSFVRRFICCWGASMTTRTCGNVRRSKLDWVIVRPVILTDGPKTNAYRALVDPRDWRCGFISRVDVADFLVEQIVDVAFLHKTPVLSSSLPTSRSEPTRPPRHRAA